MISVTEASGIVLDHIISLGNERVSLEQSLGRVLSEDLMADRDFPPFDRVTMDGIAINFNKYTEGGARFPIQETAAAGRPQISLRESSNCIEVMTGAILPEGCDTVIRYEDLNIHGDIAEIVISSLERGKNIHFKGTDRRQGDCIVRAGRRIGIPEIGVAATIGKYIVDVRKKPRVAIISTGDELVGISDTPESHQIRRSNVHQINAALREFGINCELAHLPDDKTLVISALSDILERNDCLILSGGVSAGKYDYVPDALEALNVNRLFHKVAQRPGKPFWFGVKDGDTVVFALPGNPVSSFMCTVRYVVPWIEKCMGISTPARYAVLAKDFTFKPALTYFLQVKLRFGEDGVCHATPVEGHGSGDLANLVEADAFLELEEGADLYVKGNRYRLWQYR